MFSCVGELWVDHVWLLVTDLHRDHELLHRHHVHWHKVLLVVVVR